VASSIFAAGEASNVLAQDLVLPPDLTIGQRTITNNVLLGSYYDAPGNPPETSFDTIEELRALEAQYVSGMVPLIQSDLNVALNFDQAGGNNPPFFPHNTNDSLASVWSGELVVSPAAAGTYRFDSASDDGSVAFVDGVYVVQNNFYQGRTQRNYTVDLTPGVHQLTMAWYEGGSGANGTFWLYPDGTTAKILNPAAPPTGLTFRKVTYNVDTSKDNRNVVVNGDAKLSILQSRTVPMGTLTIADGKNLTVDAGASITKFTETTIGKTVTFSVTDGTVVTGPLKSAGAVTAITKAGAGTLDVNTRSGATFTGNPDISVTGGLLGIAVAGNNTSVGTGPVTLIGGGIILSNDSQVPSGPGIFNTTGQWYLDDNPFDLFINQDSANTVGWIGLDSKTQLDSKLTGRTVFATAPINVPINFPRAGGNPVDGGTNDEPNDIFNTGGGNVGVAVNGSDPNAEWAARFTGKLNVTTAGPTPFTLLSNDGAVLFIDMDTGPGQNWQKVVDNNRFATTGGDLFQGHVSGSAEAINGGFAAHPAGPSITQPAVPNLAVGEYDYIVGTFNKGNNEYGIELFWTPPGGSRELVPLATGGNINFTNTVTVSGESAIRTNSPSTMPNILLNNGSSLTVSGVGLTLTQTTIDGTARVNMNGPVNLGTIVPATAGQPWTLIKGGNLSFTATGPNFAGLPATHGVGVGGGRLTILGAKGVNPTSIGSAKIVLSGGTLVADSGIAETQGAANTLTEYWYHTNGNIPETSIEPPEGPGGLLRTVPTGTMPLTISLVQFGDDAGTGDTVDIGARWGRVDTVAAGWFGEWTFSGGAAHSNQYTFASKSDDGSAIWIDLDNDGRFEGGGRRANDGTTPNEMILDNNDYQGDEAFSSLRTVPDGTYRVFLGWYEGGGGATSSFKWQRGDGSWAGNNVGNYDGSATLLPIDPTVNTVATSRGRSYDLAADTGNASFQGNAVEVIGGNTTLEANGPSKFGAMTFTNTARVNLVGSKTTIASATTTAGTGTLNNTLGAGNLTLGDIGASAGATTLLSGGAKISGGFTGAGTVSLGANSTFDFSKSGAAASGSPSVLIGRNTVVNVSPGAGNTFGASAVTAIDHAGTLRAVNGIVDLSGAVLTTTVVPGTILSGGMSNVVGDFYDTTAVPLPGGPDSANGAGWIGLDSKAQFDTALAGKTPLATRDVSVLQRSINFPWGNGNLVDGGTNDFGVEPIFNVEGGNLNVPLTGNTDFVVRFAGKLNILTAGTYGFGAAANDGAVMFMDLDLGPGSNWVKVADHNRFSTTGGGAFDEHGTAGVGDPGTPAIPQTPAPNLSVGTYDFVVGFYNANANEGGIEMYWLPPGGTRGIIPPGDAILPTVVQVDAGATLRLGAVRAVSSVTIAAGGELELHGPASKIEAGALSIAGTPAAPTATLDLTDSGIILDYPDAGPNPVADVRARIIAGRGAPGLIGTWDGKGITSSASAAAPDSTSVGYAVNGQMPLGPVATYGGLPVDPSSVIIRHTRLGDANLDGVVNDDDVTIVGAVYAPGVPNANWANGDFDYNGFVDDDDVTLLGALYNPALPPIPAAPPAGVAAIPEPSTWLLLTLGGLGAGLFGWRRKRKH
jgi:hypothetical protein